MAGCEAYSLRGWSGRSYRTQGAREKTGKGHLLTAHALSESIRAGRSHSMRLMGKLEALSVMTGVAGVDGDTAQDASVPSPCVFPAQDSLHAQKNSASLPGAAAFQN